MKRARQWRSVFVTRPWSTPPPLSCAPRTRRPENPSLARACMRMPTPAGPLLTTAPTLCPEAHPCWGALQRVYLIITFHSPIVDFCSHLSIAVLIVVADTRLATLGCLVCVNNHTKNFILLWGFTLCASVPVFVFCARYTFIISC